MQYLTVLIVIFIQSDTYKIVDTKNAFLPF